jgi:hypothetical protein
MTKKYVPVTLLTCPVSTLKYVDAVSKELGLSRVSFSRAVLNGLCAAKANFAGVRNADELGDAVRKLATVPTMEVQSNA